MFRVPPPVRSNNATDILRGDTGTGLRADRPGLPLALPGLVPGQPRSPCGGGANLSNTYAVQFTP
jgi:hypothetical protein